MTEALDGVFLMRGEEEGKIQTDPAAQGTDAMQTI
jgi:hypothetical protein